MICEGAENKELVLYELEQLEVICGTEARECEFGHGVMKLGGGREGWKFTKFSVAGFSAR